MGTGHAWIGTSGWSYTEWRQNFYAGVRRNEWLEFCARHFTALEVNGTFYHQLKPRVFESWRERTPAGFRFAVKGNRYITHVHRLDPPMESLDRARESASWLGVKLAAMLWQVPASLKRDLGRLDAFAEKLETWPEVRHVLEFRDSSWFDDEVADHLGRRRLAACQSDSADWPMWDAVASDLAYVRLHGHSLTYASAYSETSLRRWAGRCRKWLDKGFDVHVYFDNTAMGNAPRNALRLLELLK